MSRAAGHAERLGASSAGVTAPSSHELARRARHPASPAANGGSARPSAPRWWSPSEATAIWPSPGPRLTCPIGVDDDSEHLR
jgi:hypothetical protein